MNDAMVIDGMEITREGGRQILTADITLSKQQCRLWFRWNGAMAPLPGDALLLAALQPAMAMGCDLVIEEPVSTFLLESIPSTQRQLQALVPNLSIIRVETGASDPFNPSIDPRTTLPTGILFDGGVDAFYTFHKHQQDIEAVIYVSDYNDGGEIEYRQGKGIKSANHRAAELGRPCITVDTNLRQILRAFEYDPRFHQPLLSGVIGILLSGQLSTLFVPNPAASSTGLHEIYNGAYPDEHISFTHHGFDVDLPDKMNALSGDRTILQALQVCWDNPRRTYNCGRCKKCTRTVKARRLVELLDRESRLRQRLTAQF